MSNTFRFGIPQLDEMLWASLEQQTAPEPEPTSSIAILGPDGTGKSVFALHLLSAYLSHAIRERTAAQKDVLTQGSSALPRILYVSTDLKFDRASRMWRNFWLDFPWNRNVPFDNQDEIGFRLDHRTTPLCLKLERLSPAAQGTGPMGLGEFFHAPVRIGPQSFRIGFLDLATETGGDDWNLISRIAAAVPKPPRGHLCQPDGHRLGGGLRDACRGRGCVRPAGVQARPDRPDPPRRR
jgi:hypothetical protein